MSSPNGSLPTGSSPPTRGTRHSMNHARPHRRFIPAHAGNTQHPGPVASDISVHPRPRGEHGAPTPRRLVIGGSSPPTRGTRPRGRERHQRGRFIPAHAGNTADSMFKMPFMSVHPRPRGEHGLSKPFFAMVDGSSPPTRGTRLTLAVQPRGHRFIPAHAGNTGSAPCTACPAAVHPRPRGEHHLSHLLLHVLLGSSPPTRGTRRASRRCRSMARFIPAHAGNTHPT